MNFLGIFNESLQLINILPILVTLEVFHLDISGKDDKDKQPENISLISVTLEVIHLDISGNDDNDEQP